MFPERVKSNDPNNNPFLETLLKVLAFITWKWHTSTWKWLNTGNFSTNWDFLSVHDD